MQKQTTHQLLRLGIATVIAFTGAVSANAQTLTNLHNFAGASDGSNPYGALVSSGATLFGTASEGGGGAGNGTIFAVNVDGTGFQKLHGFAFSDGINPFGGLVLSGSVLYGTASQGGSAGNGTVFAMNTDGTAFKNLHTFTGGSDGANPYAGLVLSGTTLYGTANQGGGAGNGTVFAINTDGTGFKVLHSFTGGADGSNPSAGLAVSGNTLYGTAGQGGGGGNGVVFAVNTDGTDFKALHSFTGGADGANPSAGLAVSGNTLYGAAGQGGSGNGVVFSLNTDGTLFKTLHSFTGGAGGSGPSAGLLVSGTTLYGTATQGGAANNGSIFSLNTDGSSFTNVYSFSATVPPGDNNTDGALPHAGLLLQGGVLYSTALQGGSFAQGTVFALTLGGGSTPPPTPIPLSIQAAPGAVVLSWNGTGFSLQSAPVVNGVFTNIPGASGVYTNPVTAGQQYFRLISN